MSDNYILDGHKPVPEPDLMKWAQWFKTANRTVNKTKINDSVNVSTVFLSLNHNYDDRDPPVLFESMIFGGPHDEEMDRCSTWEQAETMHEKMVERAKQE